MQLAIALARIVEGDDDGPVLQEILRETVPPVLKDGNGGVGELGVLIIFVIAWVVVWIPAVGSRHSAPVMKPLGSDLERTSVRLCSRMSPKCLATVPIPSIGEPPYNDTSLILLSSQLKVGTLQTAEGTSEVSDQKAFNSILKSPVYFAERVRSHPTLSPSPPRI